MKRAILEWKLFIADAAPFVVVGVILLGIVLLTPASAHEPGQSFFQVAAQSAWHNWGDWVPAWCSIKIILFSLGVICILIPFCLLLLLLAPKSLDWLILPAVAIPGLCFFVGLYFLAKSVF